MLKKMKESSKKEMARDMKSGKGEKKVESAEYTKKKANNLRKIMMDSMKKC